MNPHEQAILENFLDQLVRVRGTQKIPEADAMIRRAVDRQPDAAYLLVQKSLMLGQALEQAKARLAEYELGQEQGGFLDAGASSARASMPQTMVAASAAERSQTSRPGPASALGPVPCLPLRRPRRRNHRTAAERPASLVRLRQRLRA